MFSSVQIKGYINFGYKTQNIYRLFCFFSLQNILDYNTLFKIQLLQASFAGLTAQRICKSVPKVSHAWYPENEQQTTNDNL